MAMSLWKALLKKIEDELREEVEKHEKQGEQANIENMPTWAAHHFAMATAFRISLMKLRDMYP